MHKKVALAPYTKIIKFVIFENKSFLYQIYLNKLLLLQEQGFPFLIAKMMQREPP